MSCSLACMLTLSLLRRQGSIGVLSTGLKNILRGALLAVAATFLGCFLIYTLPDWVSAQINKQMPYWFYEREVRAHTSVMPTVCAKQCFCADS